jgi:hypothetical protein
VPIIIVNETSDQGGQMCLWKKIAQNVAELFVKNKI